MKWNILFLISLFLPVAVTHSAEGDLFKEGGDCFVELADGTEESTPCPIYEPEILSASDVQASVDLFAEFEKSKMAKEVSDASEAQGKISNQALNERFSQEVREKAVLVKDGQYIVSVSFINTENFPRKYTDGGDYYRYLNGNGKTEYMDDTYAAQWDDIILTRLVAIDYGKYSALVESVTEHHVNIELMVDNSNQLESILKDKPVNYLSHAGTPKVELESLRTAY